MTVNDKISQGKGKKFIADDFFDNFGRAVGGLDSKPAATFDFCEWPCWTKPTIKIELNIIFFIFMIVLLEESWRHYFYISFNQFITQE